MNSLSANTSPATQRFHDFNVSQNVPMVFFQNVNKIRAYILYRYGSMQEYTLIPERTLVVGISNEPFISFHEATLIGFILYEVDSSRYRTQHSLTSIMSQLDYLVNFQNRLILTAHGRSGFIRPGEESSFVEVSKSSGFQSQYTAIFNPNHSELQDILILGASQQHQQYTDNLCSILPHD